jgi:hypothetical protein
MSCDQRYCRGAVSSTSFARKVLDEMANSTVGSQFPSIAGSEGRGRAVVDSTPGYRPSERQVKRNQRATRDWDQRAIADATTSVDLHGRTQASINAYPTQDLCSFAGSAFRRHPDPAEDWPSHLDCYRHGNLHPRNSRPLHEERSYSKSPARRLKVTNEPHGTMHVSVASSFPIQTGLGL